MEMRKTFKGGLYYMGFKEFIRLLFNHFLYRKVYKIGDEKILPDGNPQVIASNHQNCLVDAIAVMLSFKGPGRRPFFWARADIFAVSKVLEKYLRFLGLMPAFRMEHEGMEDVGKNSASFEESYHLLNHGQSVMIFPEAGHQDKRFLGHFTSGYTTMAFKAAEQTGFEKEIFILPVANHYSDYFGMRREMCVMFADPVSLKPYYELYKEAPRTAMRKVNQIVREAISAMMLDIQDLDNYPAIDFLRTNYGKSFAFIRKEPYKTLPEKLKAETDPLRTDTGNMILIGTVDKPEEAPAVEIPEDPACEAEPEQEPECEAGSAEEIPEEPACEAEPAEEIPEEPQEEEEPPEDFPEDAILDAGPEDQPEVESEEVKPSALLNKETWEA